MARRSPAASGPATVAAEPHCCCRAELIKEVALEVHKGVKTGAVSAPARPPAPPRPPARPPATLRRRAPALRPKLGLGLLYYINIFSSAPTSQDDLSDLQRRRAGDAPAAPPPHPTPSGRGLVDVFGNVVSRGSAALRLF